MGRNRCETAIRCLEVALHPNTKDEEIIAAVNGFRRAAAGASLREICTTLIGTSDAGRTPIDHPAAWRQTFDRLNRENQQLRGRLKAQETNQTLTGRRLEQAERRVSDLNDALAAAQNLVFDAERELAELRSVLAGVSHEYRTLRSALDPARRNGAGLPASASTLPFRTLLATALSVAGEAGTVVTRHPSLSDRGQPSVRPSSFRTSQGSPWTA